MLDAKIESSSTLRTYGKWSSCECQASTRCTEHEKSISSLKIDTVAPCVPHTPCFSYSFRQSASTSGFSISFVLFKWIRTACEMPTYVWFVSVSALPACLIRWENNKKCRAESGQVSQKEHCKRNYQISRRHNTAYGHDFFCRFESLRFPATCFVRSISIWQIMFLILTATRMTQKKKNKCLKSLKVSWHGRKHMI